MNPAPFKLVGGRNSVVQGRHKNQKKTTQNGDIWRLSMGNGDSLWEMATLYGKWRLSMGITWN